MELGEGAKLLKGDRSDSRLLYASRRMLLRSGRGFSMTLFRQYWISPLRLRHWIGDIWCERASSLNSSALRDRRFRLRASWPSE